MFVQIWRRRSRGREVKTKGIGMIYAQVLRQRKRKGPKRKDTVFFLIFSRIIKVSSTSIHNTMLFI